MVELMDGALILWFMLARVYSLGLDMSVLWCGALGPWYA